MSRGSRALGQGFTRSEPGMGAWPNVPEGTLDLSLWRPSSRRRLYESLVRSYLMPRVSAVQCTIYE